MKIQSTRTRLLASSMICGAAVMAGGQAFAQDAGGNQVEEFVVTGSRIPQPNLTSTSPVTVVGDQEAKLQGTTNVETLINNLPQAMASMTSTASNGATGTATVNLRNLGVARTLVLVDGRRLMPADPAFPVADLNQIPAALVDHVEVVTGGASAVYGSDALGGVVNFIMKKDFEGVRLDAQYGFVQHNQHNDEAQALERASGGKVGIPDNFSGGQTWDITAIVGVNSPDGKGNATVYAGYRHMDAVTQDKYDYTNCSISTGGANNDIHKCAGSSNFNRFISLDTGNDMFAETNRTFTPYAGQTFNFGPFNFLQRPDERYTLGGFAHYEIDPMLDVYTDVMFSDDHTVAQIAPSGLFLGSGTINGAVNINCDNPLMSAQQAAQLGCGTVLGATDDASLLIGRRNIEGGPRITDLRHTAYRVVLGARGDLGNGWTYDAYGMMGRTIFAQSLSNELSKQRVQNALEVVTDTRPGSATFGQAICKVTLSGQDPKCVPLDVFGGLGAFTPEALNYAQAQGFQQGYTEEQVVSASITGDLGQYGMKSPAASDGVGIAIGAEYRREALKLDTSRDFQINDLYGSGGATLPVPLSSFDVKEIYGEIRIPLVQDAAFAKLLQLEGGYRHSDYSSVGGTDAWKLAADWQPIDDIRLRASWQRAVRAPNVLESFSPNNNVLFGFNDPCAGTNPTFSLAQCQNTGVSSAQYGTGAIVDCPSSQCKNIVGGNRNLSPEESETKSIGVVFTPTFLRGFNASVDYFDIKVDKLIATYGGVFIFNSCANSGDPVFCDLVKRDPNGLLFTDATALVNTTKNTGFLRTKGIDVEANYRTSFSDMGMGDFGGLSFNFVGTYVDSLVTEPVPDSVPGGGATYDCSGLYGLTCGIPTPKWRHKLRVTWTTPWNLGLSVNWRHLSGVSLDFLDSDPDLQVFGPGAKDPIDAKIKAFDYFDLAGTWTVRDGTTLRFGVNNVFDKDPPIVDTNNFGISSPPFGNGNTFPGIYDSLGRTFFVGITADF